MATWGEIKNVIKNDLDLQDEQFIDDDDLMNWCNSAIDEAEQHIVGENQDYFLQTAYLPLVQNQSEYQLPNNILAYKIRRIFYDTAQRKYEIKRIRDLSLIPTIDSNDDYRYLVVNDGAGVAKLRLFPESQESSSSNVAIWFIGNANRVSADSDVINIPEAVNFIITHIKLECLRKEGNPAQSTMEGERERQRALLVETLTPMVPDDNNEVLLDTTLYNEFYGV